MRQSLLNLFASPDAGTTLTLVEPIYQYDEIFDGLLLADITMQEFPIKQSTLRCTAGSQFQPCRAALRLSVETAGNR